MEPSCSERRTEGTRGQVHPRFASFHPLFFLISLFLKTVENFFLTFRSREEKNAKKLAKPHDSNLKVLLCSHLRVSLHSLNTVF